MGTMTRLCADALVRWCAGALIPEVRSSEAALARCTRALHSRRQAEGGRGKPREAGREAERLVAGFDRGIPRSTELETKRKRARAKRQAASLRGERRTAQNIFSVLQRSVRRAVRVSLVRSLLRSSFARASSLFSRSRKTTLRDILYNIHHIICAHERLFLLRGKKDSWTLLSSFERRKEPLSLPLPLPHSLSLLSPFLYFPTPPPPNPSTPLPFSLFLTFSRRSYVEEDTGGS